MSSVRLLSLGLGLTLSVDACAAPHAEVAAAFLAELGPPPQVFDRLALDVSARAIGQDPAGADAYLQALETSCDRHDRIAFDAAAGAAVHDRPTAAAAAVAGDTTALLPAADRDAFAGWIRDRLAGLGFSVERLDDVLCVYAAAIWAARTGRHDLIEAPPPTALGIICRQIDHAAGHAATVALTYRQRFAELCDTLLARVTILLAAVDTAGGADGRTAAAIDVPDAALLDGLVLAAAGFSSR